MIRAVVGQPGAGKGVYGVLKVAEELRDTERHVITNLAFRISPWVRYLRRGKKQKEIGFAQYLCETHGHDCGVWDRLHVISDEDFKEFYLWRVNKAGELIKIAHTRDDKGKVLDFDREEFASTHAACYVMDETWKFLWARNWQDCSKAFLYYAAQHRHAGDDLWLLAQNEGQIDKAARELAQEWHSLVNHRYRKLWMFRQPDRISVVISNESPKARTSSVASTPSIIKFDKRGVGGSYDTAGGMGVGGMGGDIEHKTKGVPFWVFPLAILAVALVIIFLAKGSGWMTGKLLTGTLGKPDKTPPTNSVAVTRSALPFGLQINSAAPATNSFVQQPDKAPLRMNGYCRVGDVWHIGLNDGRMLKSSDLRITKLSSSGVQFGTNWIPSLESEPLPTVRASVPPPPPSQPVQTPTVHNFTLPKLVTIRDGKTGRILGAPSVQRAKPTVETPPPSFEFVPQ